MNKLDRLVWAATVAGRSHGVRIGVRVSDAAAMELVRPRLPPTWRETDDEVVDCIFSLVVGGPDPRTPSIKRYHVAYGDFLKLERQLELEPVLDALESHIGLFVAENAPRHVFVHAGVVGFEGKALVIPGKTFTGKSTLVAALVRAGAEYYSDEFAVLDAKGRVHPYPRALALRDSTIRQYRLRPEEIGRVGRRPLPVGLVISSTFKSGARWRPRSLSPAEAAMAMLANTIPARGKPKEVLASLARALAHTRALKGTRGEADIVAPQLLEVLANQAGEPSTKQEL
ncbi:MAG TPA: hypothetical protein VK447_06710 [Myxococcaceae bacterium]|nr:hypothetical protein [Myxococcaceae bacterium]